MRIVNPNRYLTNRSLNNFLEIGLTKCNHSGDQRREHAPGPVCVLSVNAFGLNGDVLLPRTEDMLRVPVDIPHLSKDKAGSHLMQIMDCFRNVLSGIQFDSGELLKLKAIRSDQEGSRHQLPIRLDDFLPSRPFGDQRITMFADHHRIDNEWEIESLSPFVDGMNRLCRSKCPGLRSNRLQIIQHRIELIDNKFRAQRLDTTHP